MKLLNCWLPQLGSGPRRASSAQMVNLAHEKMPSHRTLQQAYAWGLMAILGEKEFLMGKAPM